MKAGTQMFILLKNGLPWRRLEQCSFLQQGTTMPPTLSRSKREVVIGPRLESTEELLNSLSLPTMMVSSFLLIGEENMQPLWHSPAQCDWFANSNRQNNHSTLKGVLAIVQGLLFLQPFIIATHKPCQRHALSITPHAMCVHLSGGKHPPLPRYWERLPWVSGTPYIPSEKNTFPTHYHKFTNDIFIKNRVIISRICV